MRASQNGYHEVVRTLLEGGTDVNDKTNVRNQKMILMMMIVVFNVSINYHDVSDVFLFLMMKIKMKMIEYRIGVDN